MPNDVIIISSQLFINNMKCSLFAICICLPCIATASPTLTDIAASLAGHDCVKADVRYEVYLPGASNPIAYNVSLQGNAPADSLSPCSYLTSWDTPNAGKGFSAYFDGNYYNYDGGSRIVEYHVKDDAIPFAPRGSHVGGVQQNDRFARLLPQFVANDLMAMAADTAFVYTVENNGDFVDVKGSESRRGFVIKEFEYRFADGGATIVSYEAVTSPGETGEQIITATYSPAGDGQGCTTLSEQALMDRYPTPFEKYRRDNFSLESLRGEMMPEFSARTVSGERYSHTRGDGFVSPVVIAILDYNVGATDEVVRALRDAVDSMPSAYDLILAFTGNSIESIENLTGAARAGETILVSARSVARDCGVADTPAIIFARADGSVADIHVGRNNNLKEIVIQKAAMARQSVAHDKHE